VTDLCAAAALEAPIITPSDGLTITTAADGTLVLADLAPGDMTFTISKAGYLPKDVTLTVVAGEVATAAVDVQCQREAVAERARTYLAGLSAEGAYSPVTSSKAVFDIVMDGDAGNDPVIVSVRSPEHYALGHVPGALNIPWKTVADDASLALLGQPDSGQRFADYCYTGHTGGIAAGVLNLLGYPTANMKYGIYAWTRDAAALGTGAVAPDQSKDFTIETQVNQATATHTPPWLAFDGVQDGWEATQAAAKAYLSNADMSPTISAQALFDLINDGDAANDPFIISVRSGAHYAIGHIPGAINIPWKEVALADSLAKIPTDKPVVIYCYTGHTGAVATAVLGTLGYQVTNLKYGFSGWTQDADARAQAAFDPATDENDFPVVSGAQPGTF
jgi:rhodanese-related sulfurtransferase